MKAEIGCDDGVYSVEIGPDAEEDELLEHDEGAAVARTRPLDLTPPWAAGQALDIDASGSTIVLLLDRRPPLMVSHDSGSTWSERGSGLPAGRAVALGESHRRHPLRGAEPHLRLAKRRRLLARGGGRAARDPRRRLGLAQLELAAGDDDRRTAHLDALDAVGGAGGARVQRARTSGLGALRDHDLTAPKSMRPCRARWHASGPAAEPVAGSSGTPSAGANIRDLPAVAFAAAKQFDPPRAL